LYFAIKIHPQLKSDKTEGDNPRNLNQIVLDDVSAENNPNRPKEEELAKCGANRGMANFVRRVY
jgi:hypothetical protein